MTYHILKYTDSSLPDFLISEVKKRGEFAEKKTLNADELKQAYEETDILLVSGGTIITKDTYDKFKNVKMIADFGVGYDGIDVMYSPTTIVFAIIVIIAYSFFISGLCIAIASTSKTFKEAQSALTPLTFISFFPGMIAFMMGITTTPILSIVPFLNFTLIFTDINNGTIDLLNIGLMAVSTIIYISLVFAHIIKQYKSEKVLFAK